MGCFKLWTAQAETAGRDLSSGFWGGKEACKEALSRVGLVLSGAPWSFSWQ